MQTPMREWIHKTVDGLPDREAEQLKNYLEFLTWKAKEQEPLSERTNPIRIIEAMEKPPYVTHKDPENQFDPDGGRDKRSHHPQFQKVQKNSPHNAMTGLEPATRRPRQPGQPLSQIESTSHCEGRDKLPKSPHARNLFLENAR